MKRKIIALILCVVASCALLTGCTFFTHDTDKDMRQVCATVEPYDITVNVPTGEDGQTTKKTFTTEKKTIYKQDLVDYINNNYSSLSSSFSSGEALVKYCIKMLVYSELVNNEADALIEYGLIDWDKPYGDNGEHYYTQSNTVKRNLYSIIDNSLFDIQNQILEERGEETMTAPDGAEEGETTYPIRDKADEAQDVEETAEWQPSFGSRPGMNGDVDRASLENESVQRFILLLKERVEDDFRVTAEDKKLFKEDDEKIEKVIAEQGIENVYPMLGDTHYMYYLSGKQLERSLKISLVQESIEKGVTVEDSKVRAAYNEELQRQIDAYTEDVSSYYKDVTDSKSIYYVPDRNCFYVKHILLPFSDEQTAALKAEKAKPGKTDAQIKSFRDDLANNIVAYKHVNGEDDKSRGYSVDEILSVIKGKMKPLSGNVKAANDAFTDLIYDFNTDPGTFDNDKGYSVKYKLGDGESETYMQEFADAARKMYDAYMVGDMKEGDVLYEKVVTDYGVHIMYLAEVPEITSEKGVGLYAFTSPSESQTIFESLKDTLVENAKTSAFNTWQEEKTLYYERNNTVKYKESAYKNLFEIQVGGNNNTASGSGVSA